MGEFLKGPAVLLSAAALLSVAAAPASAQSGKTYLITYAPVQVQEGDAGTKVVEVRWQLEGDTSHEISFDVSTAAEPATPSYYDVADAGIDFDPIDGRHFVRFCYAGSAQEMTEAVERIGRWLKR